MCTAIVSGDTSLRKFESNRGMATHRNEFPPGVSTTCCQICGYDLLRSGVLVSQDECSKQFHRSTLRQCVRGNMLVEKVFITYLFKFVNPDALFVGSEQGTKFESSVHACSAHGFVGSYLCGCAAKRYSSRIRRPTSNVAKHARPRAKLAKSTCGSASAGCVPRFVEKERRPPLRHQGIRSGGNLRVFENLAQTLVAVDAS